MKKFIIPLLLIVGIFAAYWAAFGKMPFSNIFGSKDSGTDKSKDSDTTKATSTTSPGGSFIIPPKTTKDAHGFPLSIGSTGEYVKKIQNALNTRFGSELVVDGIFGTKTAKALSAHGFNPDAIYWKHYYEILGI